MPRNDELGIDAFFCLMMDAAEMRRIEAAGYNLCKTYIFPPGQCLHFAQNIDDVPARILGQAVTDRFGFQAAA